ncbi:3-isopropylmalate dehydratase small subunit [Alicyclobacillus sp. ALC3]|nr:3-isopropylmalate dehydratase small subunit [Alicyclobacillus sp. ALC3]
MNGTGRVWRLGDNVDTDLIISGEYLNTVDESVLAAHCLEGVIDNFHSRISVGDVLVAGRNFGCGSSREHAPMALKACGVSCVVAQSFARIFYRNAINVGLPLIESHEVAGEATDGDQVAFDLDTGMVSLPERGKSESIAPLPDFIKEILEHGGLEAYHAALTSRQQTT